MVIQHNLPAMNAHRQLAVNNTTTSRNLEKLSSGYRINRAGDDAAGLAISEKMRGQIRGLDMATTNAENGISLIQTAEGGLNETHAILQRMRELAVQSSNGTYHDEVDRENIDKEVQALKDEIDRISSSTHYNGIKLLDGSLGGRSMKDLKATDPTKIDTDLTALGLGDSTTAVFVLNQTNGSEFVGQSAKIVISESGVAALQIGDKTYKLASAEDVTKFTADGKTGILAGQTFVDADGNSIASLDTAFTWANTTSGVVMIKEASTVAGTKIVDGDRNTVATDKSQLIFQIGAQGGADQRVGLHVDNMSTSNLGMNMPFVAADSQLRGNKVVDVDVTTRDRANESIDIIDTAINQVSGTRADLGALQNRLEHTVNNLGATRENLQQAESSIRDVDMAKEMMEFTKNNILVQAAQSMLAQANQLPQGVLQLLR